MALAEEKTFLAAVGNLIVWRCKNGFVCPNCYFQHKNSLLLLSKCSGKSRTQETYQKLFFPKMLYIKPWYWSFV